MYSSSWHLNSNTWQNVGNRRPNILQLNYLNISSSSSNSSYVNKSVTYRWWCSWNQSPNDNIDINISFNPQQIWLLHMYLIRFWIWTPSFLLFSRYKDVNTWWHLSSVLNFVGIDSYLNISIVGWGGKSNLYPTVISIIMFNAIMKAIKKTNIVPPVYIALFHLLTHCVYQAAPLIHYTTMEW